MSKITLDLNKPIGKISPLIYGHFIEHIGGVVYGGIWVGKNSKVPNINGFRLDIVNKLREISPAVIRWPGGCFAEVYNWRDGVGQKRPIRPSWWTFKDGLYENNEFGTHEFIDFCSLVGAEPYLAVNATSLTPMDARNWVDYCNSPVGTSDLALEREKNGSPEPFNVKFFGIGNENWGGGGTMTAMQYALEYRKYSCVLRNIAPEAKLVAAGANFHSDEWARTFLSGMKECYGTPPALDAISLHYYFPGNDDVDFSKEEWDFTIAGARKTEDYIKKLIKLIEDAELKNEVKLYIDEWGAMYGNGIGAKEKNQLYRQEATMRDAVVTALSLNIFNNYADRVEMANIAQLANCLSSLFLTDGDKCITTPIYHVFDMYKEHKAATAVSIRCDDGEISASASITGSKITVTLANLSYSEDKKIMLDIEKEVKSAELTLLSADDPHDVNDFDAPDRIIPRKVDYIKNAPILLPKASVIKLTLEVYK